MTSLRSGDPVPLRLEVEPHFRPCDPRDGDELYPNGFFEFNITRLLAYIGASGKFPGELVPLHEVPVTAGSTRVDEKAVAAADLSRPVILAEIAPGRFNLIDGHHRVARARREDVANVLAYRIRCPWHVAFLTSIGAYKKYVEYWNSKVDEIHGIVPGHRRTRTPRREWWRQAVRLV